MDGWIWFAGFGFDWQELKYGIKKGWCHKLNGRSKYAKGWTHWWNVNSSAYHDLTMYLKMFFFSLSIHEVLEISENDPDLFSRSGTHVTRPAIKVAKQHMLKCLQKIPLTKSIFRLFLLLPCTCHIVSTHLISSALLSVFLYINNESFFFPRTILWNSMTWLHHLFQY